MHISTGIITFSFFIFYSHSRIVNETEIEKVRKEKPILNIILTLSLIYSLWYNYLSMNISTGIITFSFFIFYSHSRIVNETDTEKVRKEKTILNIILTLSLFYSLWYNYLLMNISTGIIKFSFFICSTHSRIVDETETEKVRKEKTILNIILTLSLF